jgi:two-component sensor histidine kinase
MHGRRAGVLVLEILNAAERGLGVTTELARAGRDRPDDDRPVDLRLLSRELEPILRRLAASSVSIDIDCVSTGVFVRIDRTSVMQILMNLVDNAAEAMGRMGRIAIYVGRDVRHSPGKPAEHVAVMTITDDGPGMPSDVVARVFDVGFSTKEGHHAGLGLAVVHSVVQRHHGQVWVSSEPGVGTSFRIELPLVERDEKDLGLVVMSSDHARHVVSEALAANGFDVLSCADALEACDIVDPKRVPAIAVLDADAAADEGLRVMASLGSVPLVRTVGAGPGQAIEPSTFDEAVDLVHHGGRPSVPLSKDDSTPRGIPRLAPNVRQQP